MKALRLRVRVAASQGVRVDLRGVVPETMCLLEQDAVASFEVGHGNRQVPLGSLFDVLIDDHDAAEPTLTLEGDLRCTDRIGWRMTEGALQVSGDAGDYVGCGMAGGRLTASGNVGDFAASEMSGGQLRIAGNCGDFAAA
ncbi:MAG TPA: formylmethanofuran dehydrogenase subunit C, partial [Lautropia sp.]|nr:formylmethanofuran dehydrogenase subunit C [Lautropia sp.]